MVTVTDIREQRTALSGHSIQESLAFLGKVGHYFEQTRPSKVDLEVVFETEELVNELYAKSLQEPVSAQITEQLLEALSQAGTLAIAINNESFGPDFVKMLKQLGHTLRRIRRAS